MVFKQPLSKQSITNDTDSLLFPPQILSLIPNYQTHQGNNKGIGRIESKETQLNKRHINKGGRKCWYNKETHVD